MKKWLALLLFSGLAHAYTVLDVASLNVNMPPGWKLSDVKRQEGMIVTTYTHTMIASHKLESLVTVEMPKKTGNNAYNTINEMTKNVYEQAIQQDCEADELVTPTKVDHPFKVWSQTFQCKPSESSIVQMYIDADPKTIYLITYTMPGYPFTADNRSKVNDLLMSSLQICYKEGSCSPPSN